MPTYRFISRNGNYHQIEMDLPDDEAARKEAKKAFAEAVSDAALSAERMEMTMRVEREGRAVYLAEMHFTCRDSEL